MKYGKSALYDSLSGIFRRHWTPKNLKDLIDSLWRDLMTDAPADGKTYGRKNKLWTEMSAQIQADWNQADNTKADYIKNKPDISGGDTAIKVAIDFVDAGELEFVYNCPVALKFTSQESEGADAAISPALNTELAQYDKVTITAAEVGLIVLNGETL